MLHREQSTVNSYGGTDVLSFRLWKEIGEMHRGIKTADDQSDVKRNI